MRTLILLILLGLSTSVFAQKDKVYLKNGSLLRGTMLETDVKDTLHIQIKSSVVTVPLAIVDEVRFRKREEGRPDRYRDLSYRQGMSSSLRTGFLLGNHSYGDPLKPWWTFEVAQEYQYHPLLNGGIGIGVNYYQYYTVFPLFFEYQALLGKRHKSWFLYGRIGHSFISDRDDSREVLDEKGGMILGAGIGIQRRVGNNYLRFKVGYISQSVTEETEPYWYWGGIMPEGNGSYEIRERNMNRMSVSIDYVLNY